MRLGRSFEHMRRLEALGSALLVVGLALLPAFGATFQLGVELSAVEQIRRASEGPPTTEPIATYEVDPTTNEAHLRVHSVSVRR